MKYIECECCGFLAVIPIKDNEQNLLCPFCHRQDCKEGKFKEISKQVFLTLARLEDKRLQFQMTAQELFEKEKFKATPFVSGKILNWEDLDESSKYDWEIVAKQINIKAADNAKL